MYKRLFLDLAAVSILSGGGRVGGGGNVNWLKPRLPTPIPNSYMINENDTANHHNLNAVDLFLSCTPVNSNA